MLFKDRKDAGQQLVNLLQPYNEGSNTIVLALPRGGVPVGFEIAQALHLPLDVFLVRKLGVPGQEELAMGAIASGDVEVLNEDIIRHLGISRAMIDRVKAEQMVILNERNRRYRGDQPPSKIKNQTVLLIDDGIATGATIRVAIKALKKLGCQRLVVAVPVAPESTIQQLSAEVDKIYCLKTPEPFFAIGNWYEVFSQTTDEEVQSLLSSAKQALEKKK
ncbi:phosphoribosyltransferase [Coxiella burnetii]|uniref:Purine/pyrimidine phosphoribosyl transferase n=1 Tax=Coxiella burnetii (strain Dugway 5J108-111) TaxID=434922 RepID=A9KEC6_COXBN|nr:phosphoribosyltransferase [Coxiella burnetii]ABS76881.1 purine/pyrimidine phosphoribosyl transferase [Coxiella burnetii Dugway 5J108-111]ACJ20565.1 purine/pyrimidine phosphoribosyl transferase [Coxiella burnetii CbuK_Q154]AIT63631.1 Phosphoribosyltransferase [Coxiella burnetii str. Namibia]EAX32289.1 phosphoribosyl transferase [Coxiella burnetii 'MSU Goat Q177']OYK79897.1 phosphoribosyl transferase [Coxiella burnetii]